MVSSDEPVYCPNLFALVSPTIQRRRADRSPRPWRVTRSVEGLPESEWFDRRYPSSFVLMRDKCGIELWMMSYIGDFPQTMLKAWLLGGWRLKDHAQPCRVCGGSCPQSRNQTNGTKGIHVISSISDRHTTRDRSAIGLPMAEVKSLKYPNAARQMVPVRSRCLTGGRGLGPNVTSIQRPLSAASTAASGVLLAHEAHEKASQRARDGPASASRRLAASGTGSRRRRLLDATRSGDG